MSEDSLNIKYGLIAIPIEDDNTDRQRVMHFCGYEHVPTEADRTSLYQELATDEEFGLVGRDIVLKDAPHELVEHICNEAGLTTES